MPVNSLGIMDLQVNADAGAEHVHFEVREDGVVQEPLDYIEGNKKILNGFSDSVISIGLMLPITPKTIGSKETSGLDELITELIKSIPSITSVSEGDPGGRRNKRLYRFSTR